MATGGVGDELTEDLAKVGGARKLYLWQKLSIRSDDTCDTKQARLVLNPIQREAVQGLIRAHVLWYATEPERWEHLISVIWLQDRADLADRTFILVGWPHEVQRVW